jgi:Nucleotidyl transferase AbiEii toxin, Type IV TA system
VSPNLAASVHARLLNLAKERNEDFNQVIARFATERFLFRLSTLPARDALWLKGAKLFELWFDLPHRPTRDVDFLGFGAIDASALHETVTSICAVACDDAIEFAPDSIVIEDIREDARYGGLRVRLVGKLGSARSTVQLDVGYGDAVTPGPEEAVYPILLSEFPAPRLRVYPRATVVAEKLEAIVSLGMANSRLKDYYDLRALAAEGMLDTAGLAEAIAATFLRRGTPIPIELPIGLTDEFALDQAKFAQWKAFLNKNRLSAPELRSVVSEIRAWLEAPLSMAREIAG